MASEDAVIAVQSIVLAVVTVTSVLGNGLLCILLVKRRQHFSPSARFVLSLCICNMAVSLLVLPFVFVSTLRRRWEFGTAWCSSTAFFWLLATSSSNFTIAVVALDRYLAIVRPLSYSEVSRKSGIVLACIWIFATATSSLPFFFGIRLQYKELHSMCLLQWDDSIVFTIVFLTLTFLLPALVMLVCYGHILHIACSKYNGMHTGKNNDGSLRKNHGARKPSWLSAILKSPVKGFTVVIVLLGSFLLLWFPYVALVLLEILGLLPHLSLWQQKLALLASLVSVASHPFIYGLLNRSIRKNFALYFGRQSAVSNTAGSQRVSTVGLLDYVPIMGNWTCQPSLTQVEPETNSYLLYSLRKCSNDSGRYSLPSDAESVTLTPPDRKELATDTSDSSAPIYFICNN